MNETKLVIDAQIINNKDIVIKNNKGFNLAFELRRGQLEAILKYERSQDKNYVFNAPTAYGKTIVFLYAIIKNYNQGFKALYCSPLKALTAEIVEKLNNMGFNVLEDTGDFRKKPDKDYPKADVISLTYERLDSVVRNPKYHEVFEEFNLLVVDEVHTIHSKGRGENLESLIIKIMQHTDMRIFCASATMDNYVEISNFLDAEYTYVPPEERPVKQNIEIMYYYSEYTKASMKERNNIIRPIINELIRKDKQALIFCSSRTRCEILAKEFSGLKQINDPVKIAKRSNYTWHHAGIQTFQKKEIEQMFLDGEVKFIFCTPTLAAGVNLPAYCVIVYDTVRYNGLISDWELIDSLEIEQMVGRAGRPQFEKECEVYILSRAKDSPYIIRDLIVKSKIPYAIDSILNDWICSGITHKEEIKWSLVNSLAGKQLGEKEIKSIAGKSLSFLVNNGLVHHNDDIFTPSFLGKMIALFYILPSTGLHFKNLETKLSYETMNDLELVANLINTDEFLELIRVEEKDSDLINLCTSEFTNQEISIVEYDQRIMKVIPMIFTKYFEQKYDKKIKMYRTDIASLNNIMERIFSSSEVIISNKNLKKRIKNLRVMVKSKTLDKSVAIIRNLEKIGDVRMNRLLKANIDTPEKFLHVSNNELAKILKISQNLVQNMKNELKIILKNEMKEVEKK